MLTWYLIVMLAGSVTVQHVDSKAQCDDLRQVILASYGRGSALVDVRCVSVDGAPGKK